MTKPVQREHFVCLLMGSPVHAWPRNTPGAEEEVAWTGDAASSPCSSSDGTLAAFVLGREEQREGSQSVLFLSVAAGFGYGKPRSMMTHLKTACRTPTEQGTLGIS